MLTQVNCRINRAAIVLVQFQKKVREVYHTNQRLRCIAILCQLDKCDATSGRHSVKHTEFEESESSSNDIALLRVRMRFLTTEVQRGNTVTI